MFKFNNYNFTLIVLLISYFFTIDLSAQYSRFSDQTITPTLYNSAYAGLEKNKLTLSSKFKKGASNRNPYQAAVASINSYLIRGFHKRHWVGLALDYYQDINRLNLHDSSELGFNIAYHIPIGKSENSILSIGTKIGRNRIIISKDHIVQLINSGLFDVINGPILNENSILFDPIFSAVPGLGLLFRSQMSEKLSIDISLSSDLEIESNSQGISLDDWRLGELQVIDCREQIYNPFCVDDISELDNLPGLVRKREFTRLTTSLDIHYKLTARISVNPRLFVQVIDDEVDIRNQLFFDYELNNSKEMAITGGFGVLSYDPQFYQLFLGMRFQNLRLSIAYDTNFSDGWNPNWYDEAIELSAAYSFMLKK